ncbi:DUF1190 domain-containing protein [Vibrio cholerae]|uniref:DUF1190 domain-containing protein n=1 Tax=Vibrio cholerae TaxID=666 RepID=UPI0018F0A346|nr:DUF1190 domain-containing protein [Vibrio cholerae]MBJ6954135.1 DUF1190 domain-containing protein [Vibrio cholerae]MVC22211.1 DUF1190 domain-containing protein [Vibrio cholerae]
MTELKRRMRSRIKLEGKRKTFRHFALAPLALATLAGCQPDSPLRIKVYQDVDACKADGKAELGTQCDAAYKIAQREADRTTEKFRKQAECELEYGVCEAMPAGLGYRPKLDAFMVAPVKPEHYDNYDISQQYGDLFVQPLFTSTSSYSDKYGKLFFADGMKVGDANNISHLNFTMTDRYLHPLPTVRLRNEDDGFYTGNSGGNNNSNYGSSIGQGIGQGTGSSVANTIANAYIAGRVIDALDDSSERRHKERMYNAARDAEKKQQAMSGAGYKTSSSSTTSSGFKSDYKAKPVVKTSSRGGWGSSVSSRSSWGG